MKKLNLESIGVQELTTVENREIDGGERIVTYIDVDGDGTNDFKVIEVWRGGNLVRRTFKKL